MFLFLAFCLCLCIASSSRAVTLGDKGKGWKVKQTTDGRLYCEYNGKFRLTPAFGNCKDTFMGFTNPGQRCSESPVTLLSAREAKAAPKKTTFAIRPLKRGKNGAPIGYRLNRENGCATKYLSLGTPLSEGDGDYDSVGGDVSVELTKSKKWRWEFKPLDISDSEIECLDNVDLISQNYRTSLAPNSACNNFKYDGAESDWKLIPA